MRLFVVEPLGTGGMIHYAYQLCTALVAHGVSVTLITSQDYELDSFAHNFIVEKRMRLWAPFDPTSTRLQRGRLSRAWRKLHWTARRVVRGSRLIGEWTRLTDYLLKQRPDVVQFGTINFPFQAFFLAHLKRRGLILTQICHEFELRERSTGPVTTLANRLYAGVYDNFSAIFLHGRNNQQRFLSLFRIPARQTHVIPFGNQSLFLTFEGNSASNVDLRQRYNLAETEPVVLFFGTLTPSKGLPELLQAFATVRQHSRAKLLVAGFPTKHINMNDLLGLAAMLGISDAVIFDTRYIPFEEVGSLMRLATVAVYPYRNGTQSAALQVAYTFGRPVIATDVGGLSDEVEVGRSGLLVSPESPEELAMAILKIVNDPQLAAQMGAYARCLSETRYAWMAIAGQILEVYHSLSDAMEL